MAPAAGLTDLQKSDLNQIWSLHAPQMYNDGSTTNHPSSTSVDHHGIPHLDDRTTSFIASLNLFFQQVLMTVDPPVEQEEETAELTSQFPQSFQTIQSLFSVSIQEGIPSSLNDNQLSSSPSLSRKRQYQWIPRLSQGKRLVLFMDHAAFLSEFESFTAQRRPESTSSATKPDPNFGAFLYHFPHLGLAALNCSIALLMATLLRRSTSSEEILTPPPRSSNPYQNRTQPPRPQEVVPSLATITVRFQNVYPTIQFPDIKTSNAHKLLSLRGRIIKVYPKRLRLLQADILCLKCGIQFQHVFPSGRYELPATCPGRNERTGRKCPSLKFELLRRTASYIDGQRLKLQEENDFATSSNGSAGRTPRHLDLDVTRDLVDSCCAGDVVKVVGVIHAMNSSVVAGKAGKRASETSTYHLFLVANGIVNTTAEMQDERDARKRKRNGSSNEPKRSKMGGLTFTETQLKHIVQVAHADHRVGSLSVRMAFPFDLIVRSLCPSIIGHDLVKAGILLGLLGGTPPSSNGLEAVKSGSSIRSNIHCLIVGDPGMGKVCPSNEKLTLELFL